MPYRDVERQRAAKRESARRQRAAARGTDVEPVAPDVSAADLWAAGQILRCARSDGESDAHYRSRLREAWRALLAVVD